MKSIDAYELGDLKRIYRTLHGQLQHDFELMDSGYCRTCKLTCKHRQRRPVSTSPCMRSGRHG